MAILPEEIMGEEILLRLPVKSLVRLLPVCKYWFSLILDAEFAKSHISQNPYPDNDDYLILNNMVNYSPSKRSVNDSYISIISRNNLSESRIHRVPYRVTSEHIQLVGSVNGLVCIACLCKLYYYFILWNPTLGRFKKIFPQKHFRKTLKPYDKFMFAFGWDSVLNDYKLIVKLPDPLLPYAVYSSEKDSWTEILVSKDFLNVNAYVSKTPSTIVKGCPYWPWSWFPDKQSILKIEIESNDFRLFQFPSDGKQPRYKLFNLNDCLARLEYKPAYDGRGCSVDVYSLNEEYKMWNMISTINFDFNSRPSMCFKYGGEIVMYNKKNLYDPKSKQIKRITCDEKGHFHNGFSHTPSLVLVKGMKALKGQRPRR